MLYLLTLPWIFLILGWVIYNLYNKNKKLEQMVIKQSDFISQMISTMKGIDKTVDKIDSTIWVQSDPSLLELFDSVKGFQTMMKAYTEIT